MEHLQTLKLKQLKNIISTHNASEKANVIKNYSNMKKPELIKAIKTQVKNEHLVKILDALNIVKMVSEPAVGTTTKIMVKKNRPSSQEGTLDTKLVEEMLMIMEDAGSKTAEKIRKSAMVDEMTAKQENAIVEDFIKMIEMGGEKATESIKKTKMVKRQDTKLNKKQQRELKKKMEWEKGITIEESRKRDAKKEWDNRLKFETDQIRQYTYGKLEKSLKAGYKPNDDEKMLKENATKWLEGDYEERMKLLSRSPEKNLKFTQDIIKFLRRVAKERDERADQHDYGITQYWERIYRHLLDFMKYKTAKVPDDYEYIGSFDPGN